MGHELIQLLFHIEFRWLSQGKLLTGLFELREEVKIYLHDSESQALRHSGRQYTKLAWLADIFSLMSGLIPLCK